MELGLHIADFTWSGGPAALGPALGRYARDGEAAGATRVTVMDHFWQISSVGPWEDDMLEAYTALGFIAAHTSTALLHTLVAGVVYREPAFLAKQVSTLDVLSGGRAALGIGAAWNADESAGLGFPFPPVKERFERLEEAIKICRQLWSDSQAPFEGKHYRLGRTLNAPQPLHRPPLMIGGGGERKTLRLVAQYADAWNISVTNDLPRKLAVLRAHCDAVGRDEREIELTALKLLTPDESADDIVRTADELRPLGFTALYVAAVGNQEPSRVVETLANAVPRVA